MSNVNYSGEKFVKANNIDICYDTFGDKSKPTILLIQGFASQMIIWKEEFCRDLASKGFLVIRFDNRDIGLSTKMENLPVPNPLSILASLQKGEHPEVPYKLSDMAKDAVGLLDALQIQSVHIVGISMGGMIAQTIAIEHPERVKTLTSLSSTTSNPKLPQAKPEVQKILIIPPPTDREKFIEGQLKIFKVLHGPRYSFPEEFIRERSAKVFDRNFYPTGSSRQFAAIFGSGSRNKALANLQIPTLVIHGDADPLIPVEGGKDTANAIPGAELIIIEGMGHTIPDEVRPQIIDAIVKNAKKNL